VFLKYERKLMKRNTCMHLVMSGLGKESDAKVTTLVVSIYYYSCKDNRDY